MVVHIRARFLTSCSLWVRPFPPSRQYQASKYFQSQARDAVLVLHWFEDDDGTAVVVSRSVEHPDAPPNPSYSRGIVYPSGFIITPCTVRNSQCRRMTCACVLIARLLACHCTGDGPQGIDGDMDLPYRHGRPGLDALERGAGEPSGRDREPARDGAPMMPPSLLFFVDCLAFPCPIYVPSALSHDAAARPLYNQHSHHHHLDRHSPKVTEPSPLTAAKAHRSSTK